MSSEFTLEAKARVDAGKGASRRLRRLANEVPAIIYGGDKEPQPITLPHKDLIKRLESEAFYTSIITMNVDSKPEQVILKDLQRHPAKELIMHADFQRISANTAIRIRVPLHFINEEKCHGVKMQGGMIQHTATEIEVQCLPKDLPEFIEVDLLECKTGDIIHISDLKLPEGVESVELMHGEDHDQAIANVLAPKGSSDDSDDEAADSAEEDKSDD